MSWERLARFGDVLQPTEAAEPILARPVATALMEWLEEIWAAEELASVDLKPRQKEMFSGPPGVGKTTLAHHLSARLGLTMLAIRPDRIIDKYVGATAQHMGTLFDAAKAVAARDEPSLLFFDEFDAIAPTRQSVEQDSDQERNAYVNTLLQRIEQHDGHIIVATNHPDRIDPAIWRRFDVHIRMELPGQSERERIIARYLLPWGLPKPALSALAESFSTASPALIRQWIEGLKRTLVIGPRLKWDMSLPGVIDRLISSVSPHPDAGKPELWSLGSSHHCVRRIPWPLTKAADMTPEAIAGQTELQDPALTVIPFAKHRSGGQQ